MIGRRFCVRHHFFQANTRTLRTGPRVTKSSLAIHTLRLACRMKNIVLNALAPGACSLHDYLSSLLSSESDAEAASKSSSIDGLVLDIDAGVNEEEDAFRRLLYNTYVRELSSMPERARQHLRELVRLAPAPAGTGNIAELVDRVIFVCVRDDTTSGSFGSAHGGAAGNVGATENSANVLAAGYRRVRGAADSGMMHLHHVECVFPTPAVAELTGALAPNADA